MATHKQNCDAENFLKWVPDQKTSARYLFAWLSPKTGFAPSWMAIPFEYRHVCN